MKNRVLKTWAKVLLILILIPVIGIGLPFGGAFVYGRISHGTALRRAEACLNRNQEKLEAMVEAGKADLETLAAFGFESLNEEDGAWLFQFPYDYHRLFSWVPCGLMYAEDVSLVEKWRRTTPLCENWYFFWDT